MAAVHKKDPLVSEKRNERVRVIYTANLTDVYWFAEPLDFSSQKGKLIGEQWG